MGFLSSITQSISSIQYGERHSGGYAARYEIERLLANLKNEPNRLEHYGFKVYSKGDEDGILEEIFRRLSINNGTFCEIGEEWGLECNSLYLIHKGWRGLWIEGNSDYKQKINEKFSYIIPSKLYCEFTFVTQENINKLLSDRGYEIDGIDFLSIDIDGNDIYLLQSIEFRPKVICIEYNAKFPAHLKKQASYNANNVYKGTDYMGASLASVCEVAERKGYSLVGTNIVGSNAFFVRRDLITDQFCNAGNCISLYNPPRYYLLDHFSNIGHPADFGSYNDLLDN